MGVVDPNDPLFPQLEAWFDFDRIEPEPKDKETRGAITIMFALGFYFLVRLL